MDPLCSGERRDIVSFVRRSSRMNDSQMGAWTKHSEQFVVEVPHGPTSTSVAADATIDWDAAFGRRAPLIVEIGSGAGDSLVPMAASHASANIVAFEVFEPAVASTLGRLARENLGNVRIVVADGAQGLAQLFAEGQVAELWTFFPDPWHKTRHHKRRLVGPGFAATVVGKLIHGGLWRLATDWEEYALWMREHLDPFPGLVNVHSGWAPRLESRPTTKYERKGIAAGRRIFDLTYRRQDAPAA